MNPATTATQSEPADATHPDSPDTGGPPAQTDPTQQSVANRGKSAVSGRIPAIDGLRIFAAVAVMCAHYLHPNSNIWGSAEPGSVFDGITQVSTYGRFGVDLFFVISGFVICMSGWGRTVGEFAVSRFVRLYPMYWIAVLLTIAAISIVPGIFPALTLSQDVSNLTMFQTPIDVPNLDGVYWTLWNEMRFYLVFALLVWRGVTYRSAVTFCVIGLVATVIAPTSQFFPLIQFTDPVYLPYFLGGMAFYLIYRFGSNVQLWLLVLGSWLEAQHNLLLPKGGRFVFSHWHPSQFTLLAFMTAVYVVMGLVALHKTERIRWRWLKPAGAMTYPLYLMHLSLGFTLMHVLYSRGPMRHASPWLITALVTVVMLVLAYASQRWIEKPLAMWLSRTLKKAVATVPRAAAR